MKLGISIAQATVSKYLVRRRTPPSQTWRSFLKNHVPDLVSVDFFTVPTATFRVLFVFLVLRHDRRGTGEHWIVWREPQTRPDGRRFRGHSARCRAGDSRGALDEEFTRSA